MAGSVPVVTGQAVQVLADATQFAFDQANRAKTSADALPGQIAAGLAPVAAATTAAQKAASDAFQLSNLAGAVSAEGELAGKVAGQYRVGTQYVTWNGNAVTARSDKLASADDVARIRNRLTVDTMETLLDGIDGLASGDTVVVQQAILGGVFAIRDTGTANGCTVYHLEQNNLYAIRLYAGPVLAAWAGMSPAASGTVNSDALQMAINVGGQVFILPGIYLWAHKVIVGAKTDVYGSGEATVLRATTDVPFFETLPKAALPNDDQGKKVLDEGTFGVKIRRMDLERQIHPTATWEITLWDTIHAVIEDVHVFTTDNLDRKGLSGIACLASGNAVCFMTRLTNIWCKSGSVVMQHSDSRITGSNYIWAPRREFGLKNETVNLSVAGTDFVPSWDKCAIWCTPNAVSMQVLADCRFDGSYDGVLTGGAVLIEGGSLHQIAGHFYQCGKWAIYLYQTRKCIIHENTYTNNNRINDPNQTTGEVGPGYGYANILIVDSFDCEVEVGAHEITGTRTHQDVAVREQGISDRNKIRNGSATGAFDRAVVTVGPKTVVRDVTGPDGELEYQPLLAVAAQNTLQNISATTWTRVNMDRVISTGGDDVRPEAMKPSVYTVKATGLYLIAVTVVFVGSNGTSVNAAVRRNNVESMKVGEDGIVTGSIALTNTDVLELTAGDTIEVWAYSSAGTQVYGDATTITTKMSVRRLEN